MAKVVIFVSPDPHGGGSGDIRVPGAAINFLGAGSIKTVSSLQANVAALQLPDIPYRERPSTEFGVVMQSRNAFVYAVTGNAHVEQVNRSLRFLKHFTKQDIVVVAARFDLQIDHDQVIRAEFPSELDNHQASILLKTGLHRRLDLGDRTWCYLDSDIFAVHEDVQRIFQLRQGVVAFAADHTRLSNFSRFAVRCACKGGCCEHLREAIESKFGIVVSDGEWQHWNGGVFVFDATSVPFLDTWHEYTRAILDDPFWKTRDQGALVATVWKFGLQGQPTLPRNYNHIVDGMRGLDDHERAAANPSTFKIDQSYSLSEQDPAHPFFLHFIGSTSRRGWRNWDEAEAKLGANPSVAAAIMLQTLPDT